SRPEHGPHAVAELVPLLLSFGAPVGRHVVHVLGPVVPDDVDELVDVDLLVGHRSNCIFSPCRSCRGSSLSTAARSPACDAVSLTDLYWDPFEVDLDDDPYETWRRMRDVAPVYRNAKHDFWALSRFADVETAHRDPHTYSSARGTVLELMGPDLSSTGQMIFLDPPEHTSLRTLVSRAFTPRRVAQLEDVVRELCGGMLDPLRDASEFDYLEDFGACLPSMVISSLLGLPEED